MPEILLVDDQTQALVGLKHATRMSRELWTLGWALDGPGALEYLASHRIDVVVADIRIPGADGTTLIEQVRQQFPDTARIVLSDGVKRDAIMSAGSAQQFLPKSCDLVTLIAKLDSILAARALVEDPDLRALLGGLESLPRPPEIYAQLAALTNRPDSTVAEIAALVERDLATTAELLKLVNSSIFGLASEVTSVSRAVTLLGLDVLQSLVLAGQAFRPSSKLPPGVAAAELAAQGVRACLSLRRTGTAAGWSEQMIGQLSVAALLNDVGVLLLAANKPTEWALYTKLRSELTPREAQLQAFGCTSGQAGGYVLGLWGFHSDIVNAIAEQPIDLDDDAARANASPAGIAIAEAHRAAAMNLA